MLTQQEQPSQCKPFLSEYPIWTEALSISHSIITGQSQQGNVVLLLLTFINRDAETMTVQLSGLNTSKLLSSAIISSDGGESWLSLESCPILFHMEDQGEHTVFIKGIVIDQTQEPFLVLCAKAFTTISKMTTQYIHIKLPVETQNHITKSCYLFYDEDCNKRSLQI